MMVGRESIRNAWLLLLMIFALLLGISQTICYGNKSAMPAQMMEVSSDFITGVFHRG